VNCKKEVHFYKTPCLSDQVAQLQEAKRIVEDEKAAVEENRATQLQLKKAEVRTTFKT